MPSSNPSKYDDNLPVTGEAHLELAELLLANGQITQGKLEMALKEQRRTGEFIGEVLVRLGFVSQRTIAESMAQLSGSERLDIGQLSADPEALEALPIHMAKEFKAAPIARRQNFLTVAMVDPFDVVTIDKITEITGCELDIKAVTEADFNWIIDNLYGGYAEAETSIEDTIRSAQSLDTGESDEESQLEAPIIRLVNQMIIKGLRLGSTDLHIEPEEKVIRTRYRVDGVLQQGVSIPKDLQPPLISRIKIMSGMNISESRVPQDGRIDFRYGAQSVDLRVSTFPTVHGENVVMRILDKEKMTMGLSNLGFENDNYHQFKDLIEQPNGIILVTGPTGSGKTTTLYSALLEINSIDKNVMTLEDPVEYYLPVIRQAQINPKAGLTFATGLRSILRQDPDVVLVGEIRDFETAEMAIRAALTGHLVFSTLHTNDAAGSISRLLDMGVPAFLVNSCLLAAMGQRLVRINCRRCLESYTPTDTVMDSFGDRQALEGIEFVRGRGCPECNKTGFKGRVAIFELMIISRPIQKLIIAEASSAEIKDQAISEGMHTMRQDGLLKVRNRITTLEEVIRVTAE